MRVRTTPWARERMTDVEYGVLRTLLPDEYSVMISGTGPRGPFKATLGTSLLPPSTTGGGNLSTAWADRSPYDAAIGAVEAAAGEGSPDALADQLRRSLRMLGAEPAA